MLRHGPNIVGDENPLVRGGDREDSRITHAVQIRCVCGEEIDRRFAPCTAGDDRVMQTGVRQEADHALARLQLTSRALQVLLQISRNRILLAERMLFALTMIQQPPRYSKRHRLRTIRICRYIPAMRFEKVRVELIGEKLTTFAGAARADAAFARELPRFLAAIWRVFNEYEIAGYVATRKPAERKRLRQLLYLR